MLHSTWWRHGAWNMLEHGVTRAADSLATLLILFLLDTPDFARLALAQAIVAPLLFLSVTPESALYRHYAAWRAEGAQSFEVRLRHYRRFAWAKGPGAVAVSALVAPFLPNGQGWSSFFALVWAFGLVLTPQVAGPDREFLRLSLRLRALNAVNVAQQLTLLGGTAAATLLWPGDLGRLALVPVLSAVLTAMLARREALRALRDPSFAASAPADPRWGSREAGGTALRFWPFIRDSLRNFSIWNHLQWIATNWVQTMDIFFLGIFALGARDLGLYSAALKLANLSVAAPMALSNLFSVWLGRETDENPARGRSLTLRLTSRLAAAIAAQGVVLWLIGPWLVSLFSRGRWSPAEIEGTVVWFRWMLIGYGIYGATGLLQAWLLLRTSARDFCLRVFVVWAAAALVIYATTAALWKTEGTAPANVLVALLLIPLLLARLRR